MEILASCNLEESKQYNGKLVIQDEDSKPIKVQLNVVSKEKIDPKDLSENVKCVTFLGTFPDVEKKNGVSYFSELSLDDVKSGFTEVDGITPLLRVPDNYCQLKELVGYCNQYKSLRVVGGNLLAVDGLRIGRFEVDKKKIYPVFNGMYDNFLEMQLSDLGNVTEVVRKAKKKLNPEDKPKKSKSKKDKTSKPKKEKVSKPKKSSAMLNSFNSLFNESSEEEF